VYEEILTAKSWLESGLDTRLAVVTQTWGSAPRPVGSLLVIGADGRFQGSVSGGCVEGAVIAEALDMPADQQPLSLHYGVSAEDAFAAGLACGGDIHISVIRLSTSDLPVVDHLQHARRARHPVQLVSDGHGLEVADTAPDSGAQPAHDQPAAVLEDGVLRLNIKPGPQMVIVGAVHIAEQLIPMGEACDFDAVVIDPRAAFTDSRQLSNAELHCGWPEDILTPDTLDSQSALIALTHDPKIDDEALAIAVKSKAFYIGALGSRKSHASRLQRLQARGCSPDDCARITGPVGLNIGAKGAGEIAVSILADIIAHWRNP